MPVPYAMRLSKERLLSRPRAKGPLPPGSLSIKVLPSHCATCGLYQHCKLTVELGGVFYISLRHHHLQQNQMCTWSGCPGDIVENADCGGVVSVVQNNRHDVDVRSEIMLEKVSPN